MNFSLRSSIESCTTVLWDLTHWDLTQWEQSCVNMFNAFKIDLLIPLTNSSSGFLKEIVYNKKLLLFLKKNNIFYFSCSLRGLGPLILHHICMDCFLFNELDY